MAHDNIFFTKNLIFSEKYILFFLKSVAWIKNILTWLDFLPVIFSISFINHNGLKF